MKPTFLHGFKASLTSAQTRVRRSLKSSCPVGLMSRICRQQLHHHEQKRAAKRQQIVAKKEMDLIEQDTDDTAAIIINSSALLLLQASEKPQPVVEEIYRGQSHIKRNPMEVYRGEDPLALKNIQTEKELWMVALG